MAHTSLNPSRLSSRADRRSNWLLLAAVSAVPLVAALPARPAMAQFPSGNDGHARDANNQVGSGGFNQGSRLGSTVTNNDIIHNNVTGGRGFEGFLNTTDPRAFRGTTFGGTSDRFIAGSNGAALRSTPSAVSAYPTVQPFYGESRAVAPPPGTVQIPSGGAYVPVGSPQAGTYNYTLPDYAGSGNARAGTINNSSLTPVYGVNGPYAPYGVDTLRFGPQDLNTNQPTLLAVSPLSGIQQVQLNNAADSDFLSRMATNRVVGFDRFRKLDDRSIQQMQQELDAAQGLDKTNNPNGQPNQPGQPNSGQLDPNQFNNKPLGQPLEAPTSPALGAPNLTGNVPVAPQVSSGVQTGEGFRQHLATPAQQSTQYDELTRRLQQSQAQRPQSDAEANVQFQRDRAKAAADAAKNAKPGTPGAPAAPGSPAAPGTPATPGPASPGATLTPGPTGRVPTLPNLPAPSAPGAAESPSPILPSAPPAGRAGNALSGTGLVGGTKTEPLHITSLAAGIRAKGLADLLKGAEDMMKQGKFASAVEQYNVAEQVAPNNPLIPLGRANAELGASSYRDAEQHLRQAFAGDPALLHAQFDLSAFMGERRLQLVKTDLEDLATKEPKSEMPAFLLAYLNYNTGHEAAAMAGLDEVEKRQGRTDPLVQRIREHWYVPPADAKTPAPGGAATPPALNK